MTVVCHRGHPSRVSRELHGARSSERLVLGDFLTPDDLIKLFQLVSAERSAEAARWATAAPKG